MKFLADLNSRERLNDFATRLKSGLGKVSALLADSDQLFWISTSLFVGLLLWSTLFQIDKSVNVQGDLSPLGRPIVIQNRFDGKVLDILVESGMTIAKGQDLILFETNTDESDLFENRVENQKLAIQLRRLKAQTELQTELEMMEGDDPEFLSDQQRVLTAEINTLLSQISSQQATADVLRAKIEGMNAQIRGLQEKFTLAEEKYKVVETLHRKGYEGQIALLESRQAMSDVEQELLSKRVDLGNLISELDIANLEIETAKLEFQRNTSQELAETKKQLQLTQIRNVSLSARINEYSVTSPVSGRVSRIFIDNTGSVAAEGTKLLEIIPNETPIVFYVEVPVASITDVNVGQPAKITLSTMDTRQTPPLEARVMSIDPDATEEENGNRYYSAILKIENKPDAVNLVPGVTGAASILLGKRTVLLYFLEPIWDAMQGALSEG